MRTTRQQSGRGTTSLSLQWLPVLLAIPFGPDESTPKPASLLSDTVLRDAESLQTSFTQAEPFPHIAIDNFMKPEAAEKLLLDFPPFEKANNLNEFGKPGLKAIQPAKRHTRAGRRTALCSTQFMLPARCRCLRSRSPRTCNVACRVAGALFDSIYSCCSAVFDSIHSYRRRSALHGRKPSDFFGGRLPARLEFSV